ncbi:PLP-dependent aminotransferase family protein [Peterkaempfera sp. SMS 1(5)a]
MTFLNEIAQRYPEAISFAAGRPYEGFLDLDAVHRYLDTYRRHLDARTGGDQALVRRTLLQYGRTKGIIHELIAEYLLVDEGIVADPEHIVVTVGCQEALYLVLRALRRDAKDVLLAVAPTYVGAHGAARLADLPVLPVPDSPDGLSPADLAAAATAARSAGLRPRACYLIPDFANPTGVSLSAARRRELLRVAEEQDLLLLEDNPYGIFGDGRHVPTMKSLDDSDRVVYLGSFAKTGLAGARVGFAVAGQRVVRRDGSASSGTGHSTLSDELAKLKSMLTVNTSPLAQAVIGGKLLEHGCSLRAANVQETAVYQRNLHLVLDGLDRRFKTGAGATAAVSWNRPQGGFFILVDLPFTAGDAELESSARQFGVLWTPLHHFYADGLPRQRVRLSFSHLEPAEIDEGLDRFAAFVRAQDTTRNALRGRTHAT